MISNVNLLSIVIPTLNEAAVLPLLLEDLRRQIYRDFEVIVVDGRSTDSTLVKAKAFSATLPKLSLFTSPKAHVCLQRNLGAQSALGKTLVFIDADCRIDPSFLLGLKYRFETSQTDVLSFWIKPDVINRTNESIALAINLFMELQNNFKPRYLLEALFAIDKKSFLTVGGFDETINYAEGSQLIQQLKKSGYRSKIVRDPAYTFSFRRLRRLGLVKLAGTLAQLELSNLMGKDYQSFLAKKIYPMTGGTQFLYNRQAKSRFMAKINELLKAANRNF